MEEHAERAEQLVETRKRIEEALRTAARDLGALAEDAVRRRYRERAYAYFHRILKRIRPVSPLELQELLDEAVAAGRITEDEQHDVLLADVIVVGRREGQKTYLVVEVLGEVRTHDVERAARRADVLRRAIGAPVLGAVAGERVIPEAEVEARGRGVWRVLDGVVFEP